MDFTVELKFLGNGTPAQHLDILSAPRSTEDREKRPMYLVVKGRLRRRLIVSVPNPSNNPRILHTCPFCISSNSDEYRVRGDDVPGADTLVGFLKLTPSCQ